MHGCDALAFRLEILLGVGRTLVVDKAPICRGGVENVYYDKHECMGI